jgi:hypothetical protein
MLAQRIAIGLMAVAMAAAADNSVAALIAAVRAGIRENQPDKQVSKTVAKAKLDERLDQRVVEELESEGAGPETIAELGRLHEATQSKPAPCAPLPFADPPEPSPAEVREVLEGARQYAGNYSHSLPDFLCAELIHRFEGQSGHGTWRAKDLLTVQVSYTSHAEDYKLVKINDQPTEASFWSVGGALTQGEFGTLMFSVLSGEAQAEVAWDHWTRLRGHPAQVYSFHIPVERSSYQLEFGVNSDRYATIAGQKGLLYIDPDSHAVVRIKREAADLPANFPVSVASTALDYDYAEIGDHRYLLPLQATVLLSAREFHTRNQIEFSDYRKFSSDALITFGDPAAPIKHLP